jgi:hypothetical protein
MTVVKLRHIDRFRDRHGKWRYYFRRERGTRVPLPGKPGSPEFMSAYQRALERITADTVPRDFGAPGTFDRLVKEYFNSSNFLRISEGSRRIGTP